MDLEKLCRGIRLQQEIQEEAVNYYRTDEFREIQLLANGLKRMETEAETRTALKLVLEPDRKQIKMLTCMLSCASDLYSWYEKNGIPEIVFWDTMGCFTRFIEECKAKTGEYAFDREWWTARQVSGNLFRIGTLEYEKKHMDGMRVISMHIPSDACLGRQECDESIRSAKLFFARFFPEYHKADYWCNSWLLSPELKKLLPAHSNILCFQDRFDIRKTDDSDCEYMEWVFKTRNRKIEDLPENTVLQKNMKKYLLNGGKTGAGLGILK